MSRASYRDELAERTEQPTPLRLTEARRRGLVARSGDLTAVLTTATAFGALWLIGPAMLRELTKMTASLLGGGSAAGLAGAGADLAASVSSLLWLVAVLAGSVVVAAVLANVAQVGLLATAEPVRPQLGRLSPGAGLKRMFSLRSLVRAALTAAKLLAAGAVVFIAIRRDLPRMAVLAQLQTPQLVAAAGKMILKLAVLLAVVLGALAVLDLLYQRWQHRQDLKMTRREVLEDLRRMGSEAPSRSKRRLLMRTVRRSDDG